MNDYNLLNRNEASKFLGLSLSSFDEARKRDKFPMPVVLLNTSKWMQCDLEQYIEDCKASN
jgi:predicted DNA-binding transcriptional regulator AlpA